MEDIFNCNNDNSSRTWLTHLKCVSDWLKHRIWTQLQTISTRLCLSLKLVPLKHMPSMGLPPRLAVWEPCVIHSLYPFSCWVIPVNTRWVQHGKLLGATRLLALMGAEGLRGSIYLVLDTVGICRIQAKQGSCGASERSGMRKAGGGALDFTGTRSRQFCIIPLTQVVDVYSGFV